MTLDDEERCISFPAEGVQSRDRMLENMRDYISKPGAETVRIALVKKGRATIIVDADAPTEGSE